MMDALELACLDVGPRDAPVVLLLHGFPDSSAIWRHQLPVLSAAGYRVLAPDMRGFGQSPAPDGVEHYAAPALLADVIALLDRLAPGQRVALIGHDWGAALGWMLAALYPARFTGLCALSVGHPSLLWDLRLMGVEQMARSWYTLLFQFTGSAETLLMRDNWALLRAWTGHHAECARQIEALSRPGRLEAALAWYRANSHPAGLASDAFSLLRISIPVTGVWGEGDVYVGEAAMREAGSLVDAHFSYVRMSGAGHWLMLDAAERVNALLLEMLAQLPR